MPPAPPQGIPAAGGDLDGDGNDDDAGGSSSHGTELSEEPEPEGWIARPITRDAARGCHFHDALPISWHKFTFKHLSWHSITKILRNGPRAHFPFTYTLEQTS